MMNVSRVKGMNEIEFSLRAIEAAHQQFTGVDFPKLIAAFKQMGMTLNVYHLETGVITYEHESGERLTVQAQAVDVPIAPVATKNEAAAVLQRHQAGETDFVTFCREIASAGVCRWQSDLAAMTCSYYDQAGHVVIVEAIPSV